MLHRHLILSALDRTRPRAVGVVVVAAVAFSASYVVAVASRPDPVRVERADLASFDVFRDQLRLGGSVPIVASVLDVGRPDVVAQALDLGVGDAQARELAFRRWSRRLPDVAMSSPGAATLLLEVARREPELGDVPADTLRSQLDAWESVVATIDGPEDLTADGLMLVRSYVAGSDLLDRDPTAVDARAIGEACTTAVALAAADGSLSRAVLALRFADTVRAECSVPHELIELADAAIADGVGSQPATVRSIDALVQASAVPDWVEARGSEPRQHVRDAARQLSGSNVAHLAETPAESISTLHAIALAHRQLGEPDPAWSADVVRMVDVTLEWDGALGLHRGPTVDTTVRTALTVDALRLLASRTGRQAEYADLVGRVGDVPDDVSDHDRGLAAMLARLVGQPPTSRTPLAGGRLALALEAVTGGDVEGCGSLQQIADDLDRHSSDLLANPALIPALAAGGAELCGHRGAWPGSAAWERWLADLPLAAIDPQVREWIDRSLLCRTEPEARFPALRLEPVVPGPGFDVVDAYARVQLASPNCPSTWWRPAGLRP